MNDSNWRKPTEEEDRLIKEYVQLDTSQKRSFQKKCANFFLVLAIIFGVCLFVNIESSFREKILPIILTIIFILLADYGYKSDKRDVERLKLINKGEYDVYLTHIADRTPSKSGGDTVPGIDLVCPESMPGEDYTEFNNVKLNSGKYKGKTFVVCDYKIVEGKKHLIEIGDKLLVIKYTNKYPSRVNPGPEVYEAFTDHMLYNGGTYAKKIKKV